MNISRKLAKKAIAVASATMLMGSAISVCASEPVQSIAVESNQTINGLSKDFLLNYYTNHFLLQHHYFLLFFQMNIYF